MAAYSQEEGPVMGKGMMSGFWKASVVLVALAAIGCGAAADMLTACEKAG